MTEVIYMQTILTSHILIFQNNQVLLVKHGETAGHMTGVYGIPGGRVDEGESLQEAAVREFAEETGLTVLENDIREFPNNEYSADIQRKDGTTKHFTMHIFLASKWEGSLENTRETTPEWINVDQLDSFNLLPNVKEAIHAAQQSLPVLS